jgi:hypothetical protein
MAIRLSFIALGALVVVLVWRGAANQANPLILVREDEADLRASREPVSSARPPGVPPQRFEQGSDRRRSAV